jgi:hypothetical protein
MWEMLILIRGSCCVGFINPSGIVMLGFADLMLGCWLEVSCIRKVLRPANSDQGFPWFSLVPEQMLSWYPNSTLHCMLPMQPSQW